MSKIAILGAGYVGLTTAACLADLGNEVGIVDISPERIDNLKAGSVPFYEPGLQEMITRNVEANRLKFTLDPFECIPNSEFAFIAVGTPTNPDGASDLTAVKAAADSIGRAMTGSIVIVNKSTVPIGTGDIVSERVSQLTTYPFDVVSNPEFLREGQALGDFMKPDRIVIGATNPAAAVALALLYAPLSAPIKTYDLYTAEMVKYASNAFLATRISFINEIARICEAVGADISGVVEGMGLDHRIGTSFLHPGLGYGGSCFPKDVRALAGIAEQYKFHPSLLHAVMDINADMRKLVLVKLENLLKDISGKTIGILGLAFKPNTDDLREAPSLDLIEQLITRGAKIRAYDPAANIAAQKIQPIPIYCKDAYEVAQDCDALILVTEWNEFRNLDLNRLGEPMKQRVLIDGRNIYIPLKARQAGFLYSGIGRPNVNPVL